MRYVILTVALLVGCAAPTPPEPYTLSPEIKAQCEAEGGCTLSSRAWLQQEMLRAFRAGQADAGKRNAL